jgi:hypothetical protein
MAVGGRLELHPRSYPELTVDIRSRHLDASPTVSKTLGIAWDGFLDSDSRGAARAQMSLALEGIVKRRQLVNSDAQCARDQPVGEPDVLG